MVEILRKQRQDLRELQVIVTSVQDPDPPWTFRSIHMRFVVAGTVEERKAERAVALAESRYCAVAATLRPVVALTHDVELRDAS